MEERIVLQPFPRFFSGYGKKPETMAVSIPDCSELCRKYRELGVEGYVITDWYGASYLNRYLDFSLRKAPMLIFKKDYYIPMVFRHSEATKQLFSEKNRMTAFFYLLDWLLHNQPATAIIDYHQPEKHHRKKMYVDSAYVAFRLSEILDVAGLPISRFHTLDEFMNWNRRYRLIDNGQIGRHSQIFSLKNKKQLAELKMILQVVKLRYPETTLFVAEEKRPVSSNPLKQAAKMSVQHQLSQSRRPKTPLRRQVAQIR